MISVRWPIVIALKRGKRIPIPVASVTATTVRTALRRRSDSSRTLRQSWDWVDDGFNAMLN
jgi:hypothetical protein